jgi:aspartate/tyrosine/aromatic aminotransferase
MNIIARHAAGKVLKRDNLQIANEAKIAKTLDPQTINATTGMFYYDDYLFHGFKTVDEILKNLNDDCLYAYSPSDGGKEFREAVLNWVFESYREEIEKESFCRVIATPGGTGAIFSSVFNSLDPGETLLFPNLFWSPYVGIASNLGFETQKYQFYFNDGYNVAGFKKAAETIIHKQGKLVTIINDPCNNPTGYNLTNEELQSIISYLNEIKVPSVLIYDIAYLDFASQNSREKFKILSQTNNNVLISITFSASKTFSVYGQRLGAQIIMGKSEAEVIDFYNAGNYTARNTWSNANKGLINLLIAIDKNPDFKKQYLKELNDVKEIIKERANVFLNEASKVGLKTYPYSSGFFITIPVKDNEAVLKALIEEEKIYLLPCFDSIRLAICSVPISDLKGLAGRIKRVIDKIN